jgi:AbrB family looped-hinge helix DNA binding protein
MKELVATVSSKGRVVIPAEVRKHLGIEQGDKVLFVLDEQGRVSLRTSKYPTVASIRGAAGTLAQPLSWEEMRRIARENHLYEAQP